MEDPDDVGVDQIARWLGERAKKNARLSAIVENASLFDDLRTHPGWKKLFELVEREEKKFLDDITRRLWEHPANPPTVEEIEFHKGFQQGALWVLKHPEWALSSLRKAARAAWLLEQNQAIDAEEALE